MSEKISSPASLPAGWTTEVRTRKTGIKDRYFTDPVSGYVFRSFKDVDRYLKTGEVGKLAFKPKDKARINVELGDDKSSSNAGAEQKLADSGTDGQIDGNQTSELVEVVKDEQITVSDGTADCTSLSEQAIDQCKEGSAASGVNLPEVAGGEQTDSKSKLTTDTVVLAPLISALPQNQPLEDGAKSQGNIRRGTKRSNDKREPELPRRASKRIAGVKLDPVPEIKTNSRTRRGVAATKLSAEPETIPDEKSGELLITSEKLPFNAETENKPDKKEIVPKPEEHAGLVETDKKDAGKPGLHQVSVKPESLQAAVKPGSPQTAMKPESPLNMSLTDLWTDPCIEFAVKTLTGAIPVGEENGDAIPLGCENGDKSKTNENPVSPLDLSFSDLWTDPCIEFAVKTLTSEGELSIQDYFQQNIGSAHTGGDTGVDTFCQTELLSQHFEAPEKPLYERQDLVVPGLPCTQNVTLQNPGDGGLHQHVEGRSGERPGPSVI